MGRGCTAISVGRSIAITMHTAYLPPNPRWKRYKQKLLKSKPLVLNPMQRCAVEDAIRETCRIRKWSLLAINVRTNQVHTVVVAHKHPDLVLNAFKANGTRELREKGLWPNQFSPWAFKGSKRRLWNEKSVERAINMCCTAKAMSFQIFDD